MDQFRVRTDHIVDENKIEQTTNTLKTSVPDCKEKYEILQNGPDVSETDGRRMLIEI